MKIVEPSAVIFEPELAGLSVCQRIDRCASVCYQRPPKPTEDEAQAFCRKLIERGHLPALEMAVVHLMAPRWHISSRFVQNEGVMYAGSIRAFMEADLSPVVKAFLSLELPLFFGKYFAPNFGVVRFATPDEIPWQHKHVAVLVICSRAISHQLVRHRPCSFLQESQRYCRYDDEVTFIRPEWADGEWVLFRVHCETSEMMYRVRIARGLSPQQARGALPNDTKTELIMYASLPEWRHIFAMRCAKAADPEMRRIMVPLREQFKAEYPEAFEDA